MRRPAQETGKVQKINKVKKSILEGWEDWLREMIRTVKRKENC